MKIIINNLKFFCKKKFVGWGTILLSTIGLIFYIIVWVNILKDQSPDAETGIFLFGLYGSILILLPSLLYLFMGISLLKNRIWAPKLSMGLLVLISVILFLAIMLEFEFIFYAGLIVNFTLLVLLWIDTKKKVYS